MKIVFPYSQPPTRSERLKAFILLVVYTTVGLFADALLTFFQYLRLIPSKRPTSDYGVRSSLAYW